MISPCQSTIPLVSKIVRRIAFHRTHVTARHAPVRHGFHAAQNGHMPAHTRPFPGPRHASAIPSCERQPGTLPVGPGAPVADKLGVIASRAAPRGIATLGGLAKAALAAGGTAIVAAGVGAVSLPPQDVRPTPTISQYDAGARLPTPMLPIPWNGGNGPLFEHPAVPRQPFLVEVPITPSTAVPEPASSSIFLFSVGATVLLRRRKR